MGEMLSITEDPYDFFLGLKHIAAEHITCNVLAQRCSLKDHSYVYENIGGVEDINFFMIKIVILETLQQRVTNWWHNRLKHLEETRTN